MLSDRKLNVKGQSPYSKAKTRRISLETDFTTSDYMSQLESIQIKYKQRKLKKIKESLILNDQIERIVYDKCKRPFLDISLKFSKE